VAGEAGAAGSTVQIDGWQMSRIAYCVFGVPATERTIGCYRWSTSLCLGSGDQLRYR
jgi:hypothetical protein